MAYFVTPADIAEAMSFDPCNAARDWLAERPDGFDLTELDADWYWWLGRRQPRLFSLDSAALVQCAEVRPWAALQYATPYLTPATRAYCAVANPLATF